MKIGKEQIEFNKQRIISLLSATHRTGMDRVIAYLEKCGFFTAPGSFGHHSCLGGLAQHSLGVYDKAVSINHGVSTPSIVISALLHDLCKGHQLYVNDRGIIRKRKVHVGGHGRRSYILLRMCGLELTDAERCAIRWHMGGRKASLNEQPDLAHAKTLPLYDLIRSADGWDAYGKRKKHVRA